MRRSAMIVVPMLLGIMWIMGTSVSELSAVGGRKRPLIDIDFPFGGKDFPFPLPQPVIQPTFSHTPEDDEKLLAMAGLSSEGPGLVEFFKARARTEAQPGRIEELLRRLTGTSEEERVAAAAELVAAGPLAVAGLRRVANDLHDEPIKELAKRCLSMVQGPESSHLAAAAARLLGQRKAPGAVEALLAYVPFADNEDVLREVGAALKAVAVTDGPADPVLVKALSDPLPLRRSIAGAALSQSRGEQHVVEKLLQDPNPEVKMIAALNLAKAHNGAAIPALIDLIAVLPVNKRAQVEEVLTDLAGEWAPQGGPAGEDEIARKIRRDCWAAWWSNTDAPALSALLAKHTLTPSETQKVKTLIAQLGDKVYQVREKAVLELIARGRRVLPMLRDALKDGNELEVTRRAQRCIDRIEQEPANRLPGATLRLLAMRRSAGVAETLLAYVPFAEEEYHEALKAALVVVAMRDGKPEPAMLRALEDPYHGIRAAAAEALAQGGGLEARPAVRKLLADENLTVRLRAALGLAPKDEKAIPVLIELITKLRPEEAAQVHDFLTPLAGEQAPPAPEDNAESRKKCSAAWADWWKENAAKTDIAKLAPATHHQQVLGFTVISEMNNGTITELGRDHKPRWSFGGTRSPSDAWVLPNNRVIVAEYGGNLVTCRDTKGKLIWQKQMNCNPHNIQVLPNGNVFIGGNVQLAEVDRNGKDVPIPLKDIQQLINQVGQLTGAYKTRNGHYVLMGQNGTCMRLDANGKQLKTFNTGLGNAWLDVTPTGKIIIATNSSNQFREYDADGKMLVELNHNNISMVTGLPNGNFLIACNGTNQTVEMDRKGKVLWEYRSQGGPFRARGR